MGSSGSERGAGGTFSVGVRARPPRRSRDERSMALILRAITTLRLNQTLHPVAVDLLQLVAVTYHQSDVANVVDFARNPVGIFKDKIKSFRGEQGLLAASYL